MLSSSAGFPVIEPPFGERQRLDRGFLRLLGYGFERQQNLLSASLRGEKDPVCDTVAAGADFIDLTFQVACSGKTPISYFPHGREHAGRIFIRQPS